MHEGDTTAEEEPVQVGGYGRRHKGDLYINLPMADREGRVSREQLGQAFANKRDVPTPSRST